MKHQLHFAKEQRFAALKNALATVRTFAEPSMSPDQFEEFESCEQYLLHKYEPGEPPAVFKKEPEHKELFDKDSNKAFYSLIGIVAIIILIFICSSCQKNSPTPAAPPNNMATYCSNQDTTFLNEIWIPMDSLHADIQFTSAGSYIQNGNVYGTWSPKGCDSLKIQHVANVFYFRIISIQVDTLVLNNPLYGPLKYHR